MKRKKLQLEVRPSFTISCICLAAAAVLLRGCWQQGLCKMDSAAGLLPGIQATWGCKPGSSASTLCSVLDEMEVSVNFLWKIDEFLPWNCMLDCIQPRLVSWDSLDSSASSSSAGFAACTEDWRNATGLSGCSWDSTASIWSSANTTVSLGCNVAYSSGSTDCTRESSACSSDSTGCSLECAKMK